MQAQLCGDAQRLLDALGAVVWRMDAGTLRILQVDCGAERLGYPPGEWTARPDFFARVLHPDDRDSTVGLIRAVASDGRERQIRHRVIRADGGALWFRTRVVPEVGTAAGGTGRLLGAMLDITDEQEAVQARDELLSVASHELRTPLTSMLLRLESVERKYPGLDVVVRQSKRLANLVEQLLDLSRIRLGRLELVPEPVDLGDVVRTVAARIDAELARVGCSLSVRETAKVTGTWDRLRLEQVVTNLLSNAIKFAPGTTIEVEAHAERARARLLVRDHGPGIAPQDRERIFQRFERTARHNRGGMGLGLYITRQILQAHGGEIRVEATPGGGATFVVELPTRARAARS